MYDNEFETMENKIYSKEKLNHNKYNSQKYWLCASNPNEWRWKINLPRFFRSWFSVEICFFCACEWCSFLLYVL